MPHEGVVEMHLHRCMGVYMYTYATCIHARICGTCIHVHMCATNIRVHLCATCIHVRVYALHACMDIYVYVREFVS